MLFVVVCVCGLLAAGIAVPLILLKSTDRDEKPLTSVCGSTCMLSIVESIPENLTYSSNSSHISTYEAWKTLLQSAESNVTIASYYWTLRGKGHVSDVTDKQGSDIYNEFINASSRGVKIRVVQVPPSDEYPNVDSEELAKKGVIELRSLNISKFIGSGILHTKMWVIDNSHFYIGSANMDWRSLTQVKELGLYGMNCSCLARDAQKMFEVYWMLAEPGMDHLPSKFPKNLSADYSMSSPAHLPINGTLADVFFASSPPEFCTDQRTDDLSALLHVITSAQRFIHIAVMDYAPAIIYSYPKTYWPTIDDALRKAAYERGIQVRIMGSQWDHTLYGMKDFLKSLGSLNDVGEFNGKIEARFFIVPELQNKNIPFTRVNHNKYMVTDNAAYIGTSNWSGDYFVSTGGVSCIINQTNTSSDTIRTELELVFERDWNSQYSNEIK